MNKKEAIEKKNKERKEIDDSKRKSEIEFLKYQGSHLQQFFKQINQDAGK